MVRWLEVLNQLWLNVLHCMPQKLAYNIITNMIEIFGITLAWETIGFVSAFVASEVIGSSKLKENSIAALIKNLIDTLKPARKEDEKVAELRSRVEGLLEELKGLGE